MDFLAASSIKGVRKFGWKGKGLVVLASILDRLVKGFVIPRLKPLQWRPTAPFEGSVLKNIVDSRRIAGVALEVIPFVVAVSTEYAMNTLFSA
ncbi:MAG: hypothetical protein RBR02_04160 [Desulfuromonadaceae bacterium]|nr:hypothetical protein [Desulfuromonadaceae bacterium]